MKKFSKRNYKNIGIFGGTFDPPHEGHLHISRIAIKKFKLKKLIWVVTKKNPLKKKPFLNLRKRIKLCKKITKNEKKIFLKYLEGKIQSNNTFDLLNYIKNRNRKAKLFFLMGSDAFAKFHKWNKWKKIPKLAKIVVFARQNYAVKSLKSKAAKNLDKKEWTYVKGKKINISSSLIRKFW